MDSTIRKPVQSSTEIVQKQHRRLREIALAYVDHVSWMRFQDLTEQERILNIACKSFIEKSEVA